MNRGPADLNLVGATDDSFQPATDRPGARTAQALDQGARKTMVAQSDDLLQKIKPLMVEAGNSHNLPAFLHLQSFDGLVYLAREDQHLAARDEEALGPSDARSHHLKFTEFQSTFSRLIQGHPDLVSLAAAKAAEPLILEDPGTIATAIQNADHRGPAAYRKANAGTKKAVHALLPRNF